MSVVTLKISRIGNSRGIRLPAAMLRKYHIVDSVLVVEKPDEIVLRPRGPRQVKLSWEDSAKAMAAANEDWKAWDAAASDGLREI